MLSLLLCLSSANAQNLLGEWQFDGPTPSVDLAGNFNDLSLANGATLTVEGLHLDAGQAAVATGYTGPAVTDKTLVSIVRLDDLTVRSGSALTLQDSTGDFFDGIVYAEVTANRWMAGSNFFTRTQPVGSEDDTDTTSFREMAISYENLAGGMVRVRVCKDGVELGNYTTSTQQAYGADAQALFGLRHKAVGTLEATIREARIYDEAFTCDTVPDTTTEPAECDPGLDEEVCEGAAEAIAAVEAITPGLISDDDPMRLRPATIRARLQTLEDAAVSEGCGAELVVQNVGGTYGGGSFTGTADIDGSLTGTYQKGAFSGMFSSGAELATRFGRHRRGKFVADVDNGSDSAFAGHFIRTTGTNGVTVGFELSCAVDPGDAFDAWSGLNVPSFD